MIPKIKQTKILNAVKQMFPQGNHVPGGLFDTEAERSRHLILCGVVLALDTECPPHWQANVLCGRTDRLFEPNVPREIAPSDLKTEGHIEKS